MSEENMSEENMSGEKQLPEGFEHLSRFVDHWCCESTQERWKKRCESSMEELKAFYDAVLGSAQEALDYLDERDIYNLSEPDKNLFTLMLALTNVSMAVELHGQPRAPYSPWPHGIRIIEGAAPYGGAAAR